MSTSKQVVGKAPVRTWIYQWVSSKRQFSLKLVLIALTIAAIILAAVSNRWRACRNEERALLNLRRQWAKVEWEKADYESLNFYEAALSNLESVLGIPLQRVTTLQLAEPSQHADQQFKDKLGPIKSLSNLTEFSFVGNRQRAVNISVDDWNVVKNIQSLRRFALNNYVLPGKSDFSSFKSAIEINLRRGNFDDAMCRSLNRCENLEILNLSKTSLTDAGLAKLASLAKLVELNLAGNKISGSGLLDFSSTSQLRRICLARTPFEDRWSKNLLKHHHIEELDLSETNVSDHGFKILDQLENLKKLRVGEKQISVSTADLFLDKDVELKHGRLNGLIRSNDFVRFRGVDYQIDLDNAFVAGYVEHRQAGYRIFVNCTDKYVPEFNQPAIFLSSLCKFPEGKNSKVKNWRILENKSFQFPGAESTHGIPILNDGVQWYFQSQQVEFVERIGSQFRVRISGRAGPVGEQDMLVEATLPFFGVKSVGEKRAILADSESIVFEHNKIVEEFFDLSDFNEPALAAPGESQNAKSRNFHSVNFELRAELK